MTCCITLSASEIITLSLCQPHQTVYLFPIVTDSRHYNRVELDGPPLQCVALILALNSAVESSVYWLWNYSFLLQSINFQCLRSGLFVGEFSGSDNRSNIFFVLLKFDLVELDESVCSGDWWSGDLEIKGVKRKLNSRLLCSEQIEQRLAGLSQKLFSGISCRFNRLNENDSEKDHSTSKPLFARLLYPRCRLPLLTEDWICLTWTLRTRPLV